ncbi:MAG: di-heme oxidoredictase family protein [Pseudomonadota bacterium]
MIEQVRKPESARRLQGRRASFCTVALCVAIAGCGGGGGGGSAPPDPIGTPPPPPPEPVVPPLTSVERFSGDQAGTSVSNDQAFSQAPPAIQRDFAADANFKGGNALFRNDQEGQGPLMNAPTCQGCHIRDGRGSVPASTSVPFDAMFMRISLGNDANNNVVPDPIYGTQLHTFGVASFQGNDPDAGLSSFGGGATASIGEAFATVEYETVSGTYNDGAPYELRRPIYKIKELSYGDFTDGVMFSPRLAQQMIGLGLLGAIPEASILANEDPNDADGDGISGRANRVFDQTTGTEGVGRYGHKATSSSVLQQTAGAYRGDMGATSSFAPEEPCTAAQSSCINAALLEPDRYVDGVDTSDIELALVEFYARLLAVPDRRGYDENTRSWDAQIVEGRALFFESGCNSCHQQRFTTGVAAGSVLGDIDINRLVPDAGPIEVLSNQDIYPYTDLLLHDMGGSCLPVSREFENGSACPAGENCTYVLRCDGLADGRPDLLADGTEWRTPPLWGIGLAQTVNPAATFLHDGRARTLEEAVLWHGGEATASLNAVLALTEPERDALYAFLESL